MRAIDAPKYGGDTAFSNTYLTYADLSEGMKTMLSGLTAVYSGKDIWSKNEKLDQDKRLRLRESHNFVDQQLEHIHPVIRRHPKTGRPALFATKSYFKRFVGWSDEESQMLMAYLQSLPQRLQYHCRIRWKPNTLIVWDNRFVQHRGVHDYDSERRHLVRTTVMGERPI
jgi:taurine dioxygenase